MVYHALQDPKDAASLEDLAAMDKTINELRDQIANSKGQEKTLQTNLAAANATVSAEDLRAHVVTLESEKEEALDRLRPLRAGTVTPISIQEQVAVDKTWNEWARNAIRRKMICMELWGFCTEDMEEGDMKRDLWV